MSTAIPPNPNAIIRALLDIAQAAYVLIHSPGKDMADNLKKQVNVLEDLPQYCNNPVNGPCRASKYLESFLVGGSALTTIAADVQRDGTEFKEHTWNAPVTGPGFTPTAEFPASGPISHDFYAHRNSWRAGIALLVEGDYGDPDYWKHELRAFDRAFDSLPPQHERRLRERMIEPAIPVVGKEALVEATRPLFVKAMQAEGYRTDLDNSAPDYNVVAHRWEGWRAAVESMGFKVSPSEALTNMLADTADEALRIINDAGLLKNLVELFTMRDPGTTVKIYQSSRENAATPWCLNVHEEGKVARHYRSTSPHQVIAVAHKGEQDHEYPEPEMCAYCGMSFETPCDAPPTGPCEQANNAFHGSDPTKPRPPAPAPETAWTADAVRAAQHAMDNALMLTGRERATTLLVTIKEIMGVPAAKNIINAYGPGKLNDIPDTYLNNVIAAAEEVLKKVVE